MVTVDDFIDGYVAYVHQTRTHCADAVVDAEVGSMIEELQRDQLAAMRPYLEKALAKVWDDALKHVAELSDPAYTINIIPDRELITLGDVSQAMIENPYRKET